VCIARSRCAGKCRLPAGERLSAAAAAVPLCGGVLGTASGDAAGVERGGLLGQRDGDSAAMLACECRDVLRGSLGGVTGSGIVTCAGGAATRCGVFAGHSDW
jgi:hypothetical protein